ncbi:MAG: RNA methyltransferase [Pseudomonadota bacterium]
MPDRITSTANPLIKTLRSLDRKKTRAETGLFLAEGARLAQQGLEAGWRLDTLLVSSSAALRSGAEDLARDAAEAGARVIEASDRVLSAVVRKDNPQMVAAAFEQRDRPLADLSGPGQGVWLALYEVRDPGNLGTILRTADCAGARGVILLETCCDPYSIEAVRASMGSLFDMPVARATFADFDTWRRSEGLAMIAASVNGTVRHDKAPYKDRAVLLMGNEQAGLPAEIEAACDTLALIPMRGGADSLNLAQAAALMTYEAWRAQDFAGARDQ